MTLEELKTFFYFLFIWTAERGRESEAQERKEEEEKEKTIGSGFISIIGSGQMLLLTHSFPL